MKLMYRPEVDGLRAIAVLSVIIYHSEFTLGSGLLFIGGFLGVDVFFVISGFLITSLIIGEYKKTGRFSIGNFYERRARRILPALFTVMLVSLPIAWIYLAPTQLVEFSESLIASLFFGSNFYWHETLTEYGVESALLKPFLHTWSLAVEEQYYIIYPLILIAIYHWCKNHIIVILTAGFLLSLQYSEWATTGYASFSFYMLPSRLWELLAGGLLANIQYFHPQKDNNPLLNQTMPIFGLFLIFYSIIFIEFDATHPGFITLIPVLGTVLIIHFANDGEMVTKVLSSRLMVGIGLISYSLYLWHYPIFAFDRIRDINPSTPDKFAWILLTFALSIATYFLIEKPFRSRPKVSRKLLFISLLTALLVISLFSIYSIQHKGVKERFPRLLEIYGQNEFDNKILHRASWDILDKLAKAQNMERPLAHETTVFEAQHLWFSQNSSAKKVLIIGNSYSKDLFNALYQNREDFPNLEFARFGMRNTLVPEQINTLFESPNFEISDIVIFSFRYSNKSIEGIPKLIEAIKSRSKKPVLILNSVEFNEISGKLIFDWYIETLSRDFSRTRLNELYFENQSYEKEKINELLSEIARKEGVVLLDMKDVICDSKSKSCDGTTYEGYKTFYDYGHFTLEGAKHFGRRIQETNWLKTE